MTLSTHLAARAAALDPLSLYVPLPTFAIFFITYAVLQRKFTTSASRAYIQSTLSSFCMTLASLPFVYAYLTGGMSSAWDAGQSGWTGKLATIVTAAFGTYLFSDLAIGWFAYPDQIGLLTGWIHHTVYITLMAHLATTRQSPIFLLGAIMELPTFDLAISHLFPVVRHDERFLGLMLLTRIIFNLVLCVDTMRPSSRAIMDGSWVPTVMLGAALMLHASWMHGGVKGHLKRRAKARKAAAATVEEKQAPIELLPMTPDIGPLTPDESPLVTPYTPSQPSQFISRDFFPNISMPTMANLPVMNIPSLSGMAAALPQAKANLNNLNFGFKEAMRERWEEQRERFAAAGLRLRRRDTDPGVIMDEDM